MTTYPRLPSLGDGYLGTATQLPHPQAPPKDAATPHPNDGGSQVGTMRILGTVGEDSTWVGSPTALLSRAVATKRTPQDRRPGAYVRCNLGVSRLSSPTCTLLHQCRAPAGFNLGSPLRQDSLGGANLHTLV